MPHYANQKSKAIHYATTTKSARFLCDVPKTNKFIMTDVALTCAICKKELKPGTKYHITGINDPAYELATEIGGDLPDGAFWALYGELGG